MSSRFLLAPELLEALPQRVVGVMGRRVDLEQGLECFGRAGMLAAVVVRPTERLEDRAFAWFEASRPRQHRRRLRVMPGAHEVVATLQESVGGLARVGRVR